MLDAFGNNVFSGQDMPRTKPHPDVYLAAAAALGVDPARCAVIEDTVTGATAGVAAGATVFGFSEGGPHHSTPEALRCGRESDLPAHGAAAGIACGLRRRRRRLRRPQPAAPSAALRRFPA